MRELKTGICLACAIMVLSPIIGRSPSGQAVEAFNGEVQSTASSDSILLHAAREIMASAGTCALITLDQEGRPAARTMDPFLPEEDFTVWFGTNSNSRKVEQITNDPRVTLYYLEKEGSGYVIMYGTAQLIDNEDEKAKRWKVDWEAFYPGNRENYLLIKVIPERIEVISYAHGLVGDPLTWEPPGADLR